MGKQLAVLGVEIVLLQKKEIKIHRLGSSSCGAVSSISMGCLRVYVNVLLKIALSIQIEAIYLGLSRVGLLPAQDKT